MRFLKLLFNILIFQCGWIPAGRKTCYFCFQQLEKIRRGKYESRSAYCPVDLFCPVLNRKRFALAQLFQNPQNNLRFFIDGKLIYSMETIEVLGSAEAGKNFPKILDDVYRLNSLDDILHQLCHRLGSTNNQSGKFCQVYLSRLLIQEECLFQTSIRLSSDD